MRRRFSTLLIVTTFTLVCGLDGASAFPENQIEGIVNSARDIPPLPPALCGGLVHPGDERVLAYYSRETDPLDCKLHYYCEGFDSFGDCIGKACRIVYRKGLPESTIELDCEEDPCDPATAIADVPHSACLPGTALSLGIIYDGYTKSKIYSSRMRIYECDGATAKCYSYEDIWGLSLNNLNCVVNYDSTPIKNSEQPAGWSALDVLPDYPPINRADTEDINEHPFDSSIEALDSGRVDLQYVHSSVHPVISAPSNALYQSFTLEHTDGFLTWFLNALDQHFALEHTGGFLTWFTSNALDQSFMLKHTIGKLIQPPEVKLILPSGGFGLQKTRSSLFSRIFPSLVKSKHEPEPVEEVIGNTPDALLLASKYLREIPLLEVEYVPVEIAVPVVSRMEIKQRKEEWKAWLEGAKYLEGTTGVTLGGDLEQKINKNNMVMDSYVALQDTVRHARLHEPTYIHELLSYVDSANEFYKDWIEENAKRLEDWHSAYSLYLPELRSRVRNFYQIASRVTHECLAPSCRMNVIPVKPDTKPWELLPEGFENILTEDLGAWLPDGAAIWRRLLLHPLEAIGTPLSDLTLDLSEIAFGGKITVPVLDIEKYSIELSSPPPLRPATFSEDVAGIKKDLKELKRLYPPIFTFPEIDLPNPEGSLFLVPSPPVANIITWNSLLEAKEKSLSLLDPDNPDNLCDASGAGTSFLMSETDLIAGKRDPASVRAASFVHGFWEKGRFIFRDRYPGMGFDVNNFDEEYVYFTAPTPGWMEAQRYLSYGPLGVSLRWPSPSFWSSYIRPQRIIKQRAELEVSWGAMQETLLKAIDTWNAQVRFHSVVDRNEIVHEEAGREPHSGLDEDLSQKFR